MANRRHFVLVIAGRNVALRCVMRITLLALAAALLTSSTALGAKPEPIVRCEVRELVQGSGLVKICETVRR